MTPEHIESVTDILSSSVLKFIPLSLRRRRTLFMDRLAVAIDGEDRVVVVAVVAAAAAVDVVVDCDDDDAATIAVLILDVIDGRLLDRS